MNYKRHYARVVAALTVLTVWGATDLTRADESVLGKWEGPYVWPEVATHMIHMPTGQILILPNEYRNGDVDVFDMIRMLRHIVGLTDITGCGLP